MNKYLRQKSTVVAIVALMVLSLLVLGSVATPSATAQEVQAGESLGFGPKVVTLAGYTDQPRPSVAALPAKSLNRPQTATINVTYIGGWDPAAQAAFQFAADIWETLITSPVTIEVDATWAPLGGGVLGQASAFTFFRDFGGAPQAGTWYPSALADKLAGSNLGPGDPDIEATFNSSFSDWYFGTDANPPGDKWDFVTVVLHEIGHGLGFSGSMVVDGICGAGNGCWGAGTAFPFIYDRFTENGSNQALLTAFPNNSPQLAAQLQGGDIFFDGPNANAANGGNEPELYAPGSWIQGSSYSHLDETVFNGTPHALMTPSIFNGEANHNPGGITLGMFADMGWTLDGGPTPTPTATPTGPTPTPTSTPVMNQKNFLPLSIRNANLGGGPVAIPNGDFESGPGIWTEFSTHGYPLLYTQAGPPPGLPVPPHGGSWSAWLGGDHDETAYLEQQVTVTAGSHVLNYWHWIESGDICGFDTASVWVNGSPVHTYDLCSNTATGGWVLYMVDLSAFAGQSITLRIQAQTDASLLSNIYLDDVGFAAP